MDTFHKLMKHMEEKTNDSIENRANLTIIRYASCWEDADILLEALAPKKGGHYLSIASGGDNSFALLACDPALVLAIDLNPAQLACIELKREAFRQFSYDKVLEFLGVLPCANRQELFLELSDALPKEIKQFWSDNIDLITRGIIHVGKFEAYFKLFRERCLPLIHSQKTIRELLKEKDQVSREKFYNKKWNNFRWKLLFKIFFSRYLMGKLGRDREFFRYVTANVSKRILSRAHYALSTLPTDTNPYLEYILTGNFTNNRPYYLREENFEAIRRNLDKLVLYQGNLRDTFSAYPSVKFDGFNLSDIFEYMSFEQYEEEMELILNHAQPKAKIAFWNMLAHRKEIPSLEDRFQLDEEKAADLHKNDKAFFYQSFVLGEVK